MEEKTNELWPGWVTEERIGEGSFGAVYKISRRIMDTSEYAALKVLSIPKSDSEIRQLQDSGYDNESLTEEFTDRLHRIQDEYALLARMKGCANVVSCEDIRTVQQDNGIGWDIYIRMELLVPLRHFLTQGITEQQTIQLGMDICNALIYCRRFGVVHRDIKPENIFVTQDGSTFKLGDFGIARTMEHTTMGTKTGTYEYMAPEVYNNKPYNATADIYSLGLVLYWMLNDKTMPFFPRGVRRVTYDQRAEARARRFDGEAIPAPVNGSEALKRIVLKACAFDPAERYATAEEMRRDLETAAWQLRGQPGTKPEHGPISTPATTTPIPPNNFQPRRRKKHIVPVMLTLLALAAIAAGAVLWFADGFPVVSLSASKCQHIWQEGDCTTPRICTLCSEAAGKAPGHNWQKVTCVTPKICTICGTIEGSALGHSWEPASCTTPETCKRCGETRGEAPGHQWMEASCESPRTCTTCGMTEGKASGHDWQEATCDDPKICHRCGETEGKALGHQWQGATCTAPVTCARCGEMKDEALGHQWQGATCTAPVTCNRCGEMQGSPLGHQWKEGSCTDPQVCTICGFTSGTAAGHQWQAATCTAPRTCTVCGSTEGSAIEHKWLSATCMAPRTCEYCGVTQGQATAHIWQGDNEDRVCTLCGNPAWKVNVLRADPVNSGSASYHSVFGSRYERRQIVTITFLTSPTRKQAYDWATQWDVSKEKNGSVVAWAVSGADFGYDLYIYAEGGLSAENCKDLFAGYNNLKSIHFDGNFHTDSVTNMAGMFDGCAKLTSLDLSGFSTAKVTDMNRMFNGCSKLAKLDVTSFDTSLVTNMSYMFADCSNLTRLDLPGFNTSRVTNMSYMFKNATKVIPLDLTGFDTSLVTDMSYMFAGLSKTCVKYLKLGEWETNSLASRAGFMDSGIKYNYKPWEEIF